MHAVALTSQQQRWIAALLAAVVAYLATWCEYNHVAFHAAAIERASLSISQGGSADALLVTTPEEPCSLCEWSASLNQSPTALSFSLLLALFVVALAFVLLREAAQQSPPQRAGARAPPTSSF